MKNIDFLKLLCISNGYHRNIEIETWKDDCGSTLYSVFAENDYFLTINASCGLFSDIIHDVVRDIANNAYYLKVNPDFKEKYKGEEGYVILTECEDYPHIDMSPWYLGNLPNKYLFNDEYRNLIIEKNDKLEKLKERESAFEKNLNKYPIKPCLNCAEKIHTDIPCNEECELHYNMSCKKLRKWMDEDIPKYHKEYSELEEVKRMRQKFDNIQNTYNNLLKNCDVSK